MRSVRWRRQYESTIGRLIRTSKNNRDIFGRPAVKYGAKRVSQQFLTVWIHCLFGESVSHLVLFRAGAPARLKFASRCSGYQSRPGRIIHDLTLGSGFVASAMADFAGQRFSLGRRANLRRFAHHFLFRGVWAAHEQLPPRLEAPARDGRPPNELGRLARPGSPGLAASRTLETHTRVAGFVQLADSAQSVQAKSIKHEAEHSRTENGAELVRPNVQRSRHRRCDHANGLKVESLEQRDETAQDDDPDL
jgi:hypothetical protein